MSLLIESTIKVSLIALVALVSVAFLQRRSAALRHWILGAALLGVAIAPLLRPIAPAWNVQISAPTSRPPAAPAGGRVLSANGIARAGTPQGTLSQTAGAVSAPVTAPWRVERVVGFVWAAGVALSLLVLMIGLARLAWLASRAEQPDTDSWTTITTELSHSLGLSRPITLLQTDHPSVPATWGFLRPRVVLPTAARDWPVERLRVVLLHELTHIQRGDWLTQLLAECVRAVYWFNPLVWMVARRLRQESEQACDDGVLSNGIDNTEYASHLLALARSVTGPRRPFAQPFPAPAMARPSSLERRFAAMLNNDLNRTPLTRRARFTTIAVALAIAVLVAGLGAQTFSTFSGSVVDSTNRVVPGVTLALVNTQTQAKYEIKSDSNGRFEFVGLPPGAYTWTAAMTGFSTLKGDLTVSGRDAQQNMELHVGSLAETITVKGGAATSPARRPASSSASSNNPNLTPKPCVAGPTGGVIKQPAKVFDMLPVYPADLNAAKIGGVVILNAVVDTAGGIRDLTVLRSPNPELATAAMDAVWQWRYTVTTLNCVPTEVHITVAVNFSAD